MQKRVLIIIVIITAITIAASFYAQKKAVPPTQKFPTAASFYVLGNFIENIGGDTVSVKVITPPGIESHEYEPTPGDLITVGRSKLFLYNGAGFDPWAEKLISSLNQGGVVTVSISEYLNVEAETPTPARPDITSGERVGVPKPTLQSAQTKSLGKNQINTRNPHYWLDPIRAIKEVEIIRDILIKENPSGALVYKENARLYIEKLRSLDREYEAGLRSCDLRDMIVSHDAFAYLGSRYTINTIPIAGISPEDEPSAKKLGEIAEMAREKGISFIFFETAASPKLAETIAREIGVETLVLNPIETLTEAELKSGEDYISVMKKNLNNLRKALSCI